MERRTFNFEVKGHKIRTRTNRRYAVVACRPVDQHVVRESRPYGKVVESWQDHAAAVEAKTRLQPHEPEALEVVTYVAYAEVVKRTDNLATARKFASNYGWNFGSSAVVIDVTTGLEPGAPAPAPAAPYWYELVREAMDRRGEQLLADVEHIEPLYEMALEYVELDPSLDLNADRPAEAEAYAALEREAAERTAAALLALSQGEPKPDLPAEPTDTIDDGYKAAVDQINHQAADDRFGVSLELRDWMQSEYDAMTEIPRNDFTQGYINALVDAIGSYDKGSFALWLGSVAV